jgi:hypothetical protein
LGDREVLRSDAIEPLQSRIYSERTCYGFFLNRP